MGRVKSNKSNNSANIGFEAKLWLAADKLRSNMDAAEYKHVVLGLIFLKYISDSFEEHHAKLVAGQGDYAGSNPEDPDEYRAENIFWVPPAARWTYLQNSAKQPTIGKIVDDAMVAIERDNPRLKGILPKDYARPALDKNRLGELIDLIGTIGLGDKANRSKDILGRVYEYFLSRFASAEGKKGGQFYTPQSVVRLLANPPFNDSDWFRKDDDARWQFGLPPRGNANFAWVQHFIHHLAPTGMAGFVLANGSMSSNQSGEGEIRRAIIEADLVDCMVALPSQLFYSTAIPVCLWFLSRDKRNARFRDRRRQTLFIDARKLGHLIDRVHREFTDEEAQRIAETYYAWRGAHNPLRNPHSEVREYVDVPGFCKSATTDEIAQHGYVLTPGRYVGAKEIEDEGEPFDEK